MKRNSLFFAIAIAVLAAGFSAVDARAGSLPTTLDKLIGPPALSVTTGLEPDTFSNFSFSASAIPPTTPVLTAAGITVSAFGPVGNESGITFSGAMFAPAGTIVDYAFGYTVTAPKGFLINDALLVGTFSTFGGTGSVSVGETLLFPDHSTLALEAASPPGSVSDSVAFAGVSSIVVTKDVILNGGSNGASVSIINQGFSSSAVPEPASLALLGIGMTGFLAFRRFFKKTSVA